MLLLLPLPPPPPAAVVVVAELVVLGKTGLIISYILYLISLTPYYLQITKVSNDI
jgi:hypothetical protein